MMNGLRVEAYHPQYGWWQTHLNLPDWWNAWESLTFTDEATSRRVVEIQRGEIVDRFAALDAKIDRLIALLEGRGNVLG